MYKLRPSDSLKKGQCRQRRKSKKVGHTYKKDVAYIQNEVEKLLSYTIFLIVTHLCRDRQLYVYIDK